MISTRYYIDMPSTDHTRIRDIIDRLGRIIAAEEWNDDINPTQWTALSYLARANRFSRSPSQVSDYMVATRGTVSQTLKALARKGLVEERRSDQDKRSISYSVTGQGLALLEGKNLVEDTASMLSDRQRAALLDGLETLMRNALAQRRSRPFGVCRSCTYHQKSGDGGFCKLLCVPLSPVETGQICHEHSGTR